MVRATGLLLAVGVGCGSVPGEVRSDAVTPAAEVRAEPVRAPVRTCPIAQATPQPLQLAAVSGLDEAAGKRWLVALRDEKPALLHLGAAGELVSTPVPAWTEDAASEAGALRMIRTTAPPGWWTVDLRDPERPTPGSTTPVGAAVAGEHPKGFASDGTRAVLAMYRAEDGPGGRRYVGETFFLDVATGEPIGEPAAMTVWVARCHGGRCWGYANRNADDAAVIAGFGDDGHRVLATLGKHGCAGVRAWQQGDLWSLAWSDRAALGVATVDITTGEVRVDRAPVPGDADKCAYFEPISIAGRHGVLIGHEQSRVFLEAHGDRTFGAPEALPLFDHGLQALVPFGDGVVAIQYTSRAGLRHGPEDAGGVREYHEEWAFEGSHGFLRREGGRWQHERGGPLPHSGESGQHSRGYRVHLLTRPDHVGVLVAGDGLASAYLPLRSACP